MQHSAMENTETFKPYGDLVDQAFVQFNENLINNHQGQNTPIKVIQKKEKQTKLLHFQISWHRYYQTMELQRL